VDAVAKRKNLCPCGEICLLPVTLLTELSRFIATYAKGKGKVAVLN